MTCDTLKTKFGNAKISTLGYYQITSKKEGNYKKMLHRLIFEDYHGTEIPEDILIHHKDGNKLNNDIDNLIPMERGKHTTLHHTEVTPSEETRKKISEGNKGKIISDETKQKISEANKGRVCSEETKKKISEKHKGKKLSEETKNKLRIVHRGQNNGMYGKNHSEESKRKISENRKEIYHSLSARIEMSRKNNKTGYYRVSQKIDKKYPDYISWTYSITHNGKHITFTRKRFLDLKEKVETENPPWLVLDETKAKKTLQIAGLLVIIMNSANDKLRVIKNQKEIITQSYNCAKKKLNERYAHDMSILDKEERETISQFDDIPIDDIYNEESKVKKYRKKPVIVTAYQTDHEEYIETLEGKMKAKKGDYIITGIKGEKYPCKPDIFENTYEEVKE